MAADELNYRVEGYMAGPNVDTDKILYTKGAFTSTILTSLPLFGNVDLCQGITWDDEDLGYASDNLHMHQLSGRFSSTIRASIIISIVGPIAGMTWSAALDTGYGDSNSQKFFLSSGRFSSTIRSSFDSLTFFIRGMAVDGCDMMASFWENDFSDPSFLRLYSGQVTSTIRTSLDIASLVSDGISGFSWDDKNVATMSRGIGGTDIIFLLSGRFSSTVKASLASAHGRALTADDFEARVHGISGFDNSTEKAEQDAATNTLNLWGGEVDETPEPGGGGGGGADTPTFRIHAGFEENTWPDVGTLYDWEQLAAGFTWEELCGAAVLDKDILSLRITKKLATVLDGITVGRCDFLLDNRDGRYSPESDKFAMRTNQPVGVKVITAAGSVYSLFAGFADRYSVQPALDRMTAHVGASDVTKFLRRKINLGLRIGVTPASLLEDVLVAAGIPTAFYDIATTTITDSISVAFIDNITAGDAVGQIIKSGAHFAWVSNDGALTFRPRGTDKGLTSSQSYENSFFEFSYEKDDQSVVNDIGIKVNPFRLPATAQQTVAWIEGPVQLTPQGSLSFLLDYRDPVTMGTPFPVNSIATPVASDDYLAFEECTGSGANLTSQLSVTVTTGATSAIIDIVNNGCPGCLTKFQLRGIPLIDQPSFTVPAFNLESQALHGTETLVIEQNIITDLGHNKDLALHLLTGSPQPEVRWSKKNWYPDIYLWDLFQKVSLVESNTAVSSIWLIEEIDHTIDLKRGHQHTLTARVFQESP